MYFCLKKKKNTLQNLILKLVIFKGLKLPKLH